MENILESAQYYEADLIIYTVFTNDNLYSPFFESKIEKSMVYPAILMYWWRAFYYVPEGNFTPATLATYQEAIEAMPDNVLYFSIEDDVLAEIANAHVLPETDRISRWDTHLSPEGNQTAVEFMLPFIQDELEALGCL